MADQTPAQIVMRAGRELYGHFAVQRLSENLPLAKRNVERIAAAAREGGDYPAARAVLGDLHRLVAERKEEMDVLLDTIEDAQQRLGQAVGSDD